MGFFPRCYLLLTLFCGGHILTVRSQLVCVHMKECQVIYKLFEDQNGQETIKKLICEDHERYPKIWCKISCVTNSNEEGFCSLPSDCDTLELNESNAKFCDIDESSNKYLCCPIKKSLEITSFSIVNTTLESIIKTSTTLKTTTPIILETSPIILETSPIILETSPITLKTSPTTLKTTPSTLNTTPSTLKTSSIILETSTTLKTSPSTLETSPTTLKTTTEDVITTMHTTINLRNNLNLDICGIQEDTVKVANGKIASMFDHPWSVLLQYLEKGKLAFKCGGTLLSDRFVLTAAHCLHKSTAKLLYVILGEYNITSERDCFKGYCMPKPLRIGIKNIEVHPDSNKPGGSFYTDIALIELKRKVEYNEFIRPICLDPVYKRSQNPLVVVGWGKTEFEEMSDVKRVANLELQPNSACLNTISLPLKESQLCVGGGNADSCDGDSGGPLLDVDYSSLQPTWKLIGVVSLGSGKCGSIGKPAIYVNVSYFYDWIINKIT